MKSHLRGAHFAIGCLRYRIHALSTVTTGVLLVIIVAAIAIGTARPTLGAQDRLTLGTTKCLCFIDGRFRGATIAAIGRALHSILTRWTVATRGRFEVVLTAIAPTTGAPFL